MLNAVRSKSWQKTTPGSKSNLGRTNHRQIPQSGESKLLVMGDGSHATVVRSILSEAKNSPGPIVSLDTLGRLSDSIFTRLRKRLGRPIPVFVALGANFEREEVTHKISQLGMFSFPPIIHASAFVSKSAQIGAGTIILPNAHVGPEARVGAGCILGVGSSLDHHGEMGNFASLGPGTHTAGNVGIGDRAFLGIGSKVIERVRVGEDSLVGAGTLVLRDVPRNSVVMGCPGTVVRTRGREEPYFRIP